VNYLSITFIYLITLSQINKPLKPDA
jgi:hypothetical protein